jgi:type IV pilus assembly protein PilV
MTETLHRGRTSSGFTLIEVLITIIVLAIGILGVAGLQMAGMRANYSAYLRTQATFAAADLIDRMRIDPGAFAGGTFRSTTTTASPTFNTWAANLGNLLPTPQGGAVQGEVLCGTGNGCADANCEIIIRWDDARAEDATVAQQGRSLDALQFRVCTRLPEDR